MFKNKEQQQELKDLLATLFQDVADLKNPYKFDVGDKVIATCMGTPIIEYVGDIVGRSYTYRTVNSEYGVFPEVRINAYNVYNTRSKTVHLITDEAFVIQHKSMIH
jgi:hypothetical protein